MNYHITVRLAHITLSREPTTPVVPGKARTQFFCGCKGADNFHHPKLWLHVFPYDVVSSRPLPEDLTGKIEIRSGGDHDEKHYHTVEISEDFYMSSLEVTNVQFELFNASHKVSQL